MKIYIGNYTNFIILKKYNSELTYKTFIYIFNNIYYFIAPIHIENTYINSLNHVLYIKTFQKINNKKKNKLNHNLFNLYKDFFSSWNFFPTTKFFLTGKGFKLKKKHNFTQFFVNTSHKMILLSNTNFIKKITKNKFLLILLNKKYNNHKLTYIAKLNIFSKRGLRSSRQIIPRKQGKSNTT